MKNPLCYIEDFFRNLRYGLKNIIIWLPAIWGDRQWDFHFIYIILRHKLKLTEKCIRNGMHLHRERDADQIKLCINLLDRLINDVYHEMIFDPHHEKWGEPKFKLKQLENSSDLHCEIEHKNVKTEKDEEQMRKEFKRACNHEEILKQQDINLLFNTMRKHIRGWWD